ncbi:MAG: hypothetical protein F6K53_20340 [Moorea sp. SIO4A1]|uniref:hypothetical protein n=1 Tax=Moorena sp. SIO4A1 TaxID=2607835 RepID=UPI00144E9C9E|nr:hypothetical protein [Moorena sp. SIO4A1]NEQ59622.1 hypothetical protein [Moorena sp. SIO4A1]
MIEASILDLWISDKLTPLREQLKKVGIPVSLLPLEAADYSDDSQNGFVSIALPQVIGAEPERSPQGYTVTTQELTYELSILVMTARRYKYAEEERSSLEQITDAILYTLVGQRPPYPNVIVPLWLLNYQLQQPEGTNWIANLVLRFTAIVNLVPDSTPNYSKYTTKLKLFTVFPESEVLVETFEIPPKSEN